MNKWNRWDFDAKHLWKLFAALIFGLVFYGLIDLSRQVNYKSVNFDIIDKSEFSIDVCYKLYIKNDSFCKVYEDIIPKLDFNCNFDGKPISCYTKDFKSLNASEIIKKFKGCNISNLFSIDSKIEQIDDVIYQLYYGYVCVKYRYKLPDKEIDFFIKSSEKTENFNLFLNLIREHEDGTYKSKRILLFKRKCWKEKNERIECSETYKNIWFKAVVYSARHLEYPFTTNCLNREDKNGVQLSQNDLYEDCIKKEKKYYLLTYDEKDDFQLEYNKSQDFKSLIEKCSNLNKEEDCKSTTLHLDDLEQLPSKKNGSIIIKIRSGKYKLSFQIIITY